MYGESLRDNHESFHFLFSFFLLNGLLSLRLVRVYFSDVYQLTAELRNTPIRAEPLLDLNAKTNRPILFSFFFFIVLVSLLSRCSSKGKWIREKGKAIAGLRSWRTSGLTHLQYGAESPPCGTGTPPYHRLACMHKLISIQKYRTDVYFGLMD